MVDEVDRRVSARRASGLLSRERWPVSGDIKMMPSRIKEV
jgi:hypothetical protein